MSNRRRGGIRKLNFSMFSYFFSDKIIALEYGFIVFSIKITNVWCIFIVFISINGLIQAIVSIIELLFVIVFYINKITTLKWPEWSPLKCPVHSVIFSVHKIWPSLSLKISKKYGLAWKYSTLDDSGPCHF